MRASALLRDPSGLVHKLGPGELIGRLWSASLQVDDPRVSEAHAMVSLRGGELRLLALRALFAVDGKPLREVTLEPGLLIELARGLVLTVEDVLLPESLLALEIDGLGRQVLPNACWLFTSPQLSLGGRPGPGAAAAFWSSGDGWKARIGDEPPVAVEPGREATIAGRSVRAKLEPIVRASRDATRAAGRVDAPLRIVCHYDVVLIEREGLQELKLTGNAARLISELAEVGGPVEWQPMAGALWPDDVEDQTLLRKRWDMLLYRLRRKLAARSLRPDLVAPDGAGRVMLQLGPEDQTASR